MGLSPLITIGITCYNAKETISRAVESARAQTWPNFEILITDDCSNDGSWDILKELDGRYEKVRTVRIKKNGGVGAARQCLVDNARGEFIAFFDDDDSSVPQRLERQYQRIVEFEAANPNAPVFCYCDRNVVRPGELRASFRRLGIGRFSPEPSGPPVADYVLSVIRDDGQHSWGMLGSCTLMARTDVVRTLGGFDEKFRRCEEGDLAIRGALAGAHFISVDDALVTQYLTETTDKSGNADLRYRLMLLRKHKAYAASRGAYWGAFANMRASFHFAKGRLWRGRIWRAMALALFPLSTTREWLRWRSGRA